MTQPAPARTIPWRPITGVHRSTSFLPNRGRPAKSGFHAHDFHALGTGLSEETLVRMETSAQYLKFAETCDRVAKLAKTERHRMTLKEMAEIWRKLAQEADTKD
jgi:hypothetical protein